MNATNRAMNRVVLLVAGLVLLAGGTAALGAAMLAGGAAPAPLRDVAAALDAATAAASQPLVDVPGAGRLPLAALVAIGAGVALVILLLVFLCTRGGGGAREIWEARAADGRTAVDRSVADALLTTGLADRPDVLSARTAAYRVRRQPAIRLAVTARPGAGLPQVIAAAEAAVDDWDALLGRRMPVVLHLADRRWRDTLHGRTRVE